MDLAIFQWLNGFAGASPALDMLIRFCAVYLWYVMVGGALGVVLIPCIKDFKNFRHACGDLLLYALSAAVIARFVVTEFIRVVYERARPFEVVEGTRQLVEHSAGAAFPSGHASFVFAIAAAVAAYYPKTGALFFAAATAIAVARVAAGIHWPSDVLAGAIVGIATALILRKIFKKFCPGCRV